MPKLYGLIDFKMKEPFEGDSIIAEICPLTERLTPFSIPVDIGIQVNFSKYTNSRSYSTMCFSFKSNDESKLDSQYLYIYLNMISPDIKGKISMDSILNAIKNIEIIIPSTSFQKFFVKRHSSIVREAQQIRRDADVNEKKKIKELYDDFDKMIDQFRADNNKNENNKRKIATEINPNDTKIIKPNTISITNPSLIGSAFPSTN